MINKFKEYFNFTSLFVFIWQLVYIVYLNHIGYLPIHFDLYTWFQIVLSFISLFSLIQIVGFLFENRRFSRAIVFFAIIVIHFTLFWYHKKNFKPFDFELAQKNAGLIFYSESFTLILNNMGRTYFDVIIILLVLFIILEFKFKLISNWTIKEKRIQKVISFSIIYVATFFFQITGFDNIQGALRSLSRIDFYNIYKYPEFKKINIESINYSKKFNFQDPHFKKRPNVILVLIESLNGELVGSKAAGTNKKVLPYIDSLIKKSYYVKNYYANSIQTDKGMYSILCSTIPSFENSAFKYYVNNSFNCLPEILSNNGYDTIFFQAFRDLGFGNKKEFLSKNGFNVVETVHRYLKKGDKKFYWGWGLQDDIYYKRFFEYMDSKIANAKKPFFATLLTVSSHMAFRHIPHGQKYLYNYRGKDNKKNYLNAIHLADKYLETFFIELKKRDYYKNTLVIITGDHGYPAGKHGYTSNHLEAYDDTFKTPFLMFWDGVIKPEINSENYYSHIDVAPTVLDIAGISTKTHFLGNSLFSGRESVVYLVQPFNGVYLSVIKDGYKYVLRKKRKEERLFYLLSDPDEKSNLIDNLNHYKILKDLKNEMGKMIANQKLLDSNSIWRD